MKRYRTRNGKKAKKWALDVKKRDGYTCRHCARKDDLHAHHISSWDLFPKLRYEVYNGLTLCRSCHAKLHMTGHQVSEITKDKIRKAKAGKSSWNKGKKLSQEHIEKLIRAKIGHIPWNKGIKNENPEKKVCKMCSVTKEISQFTPLQRGKWISNTCKYCRNLNLKKDK